MKHCTIGVIIAARMTSKRFPGKSMAVLHGKPVIQWTMERARMIYKNAVVVLAVPDADESEPMLELAASLGIPNFCGSELDVLDRMYRAAEFFKMDVIVRVTGDCPFIDPIVCNEVLSLLMWRKLDYASNVFPVRTYPKGVDCEAFTFDCLETAWKLAKREDQREHVTKWMQETKEVNKANLTQALDVSYKNFCVDFPDDIERLEKEIQLVDVKDTGRILQLNGHKSKQLIMPDKRIRVTI